MRIAQVSTGDGGGGAERMAMTLHRGLRELGHDVVTLVWRKTTDEPGVVAVDIEAHRPAWQRRVARIDRRLARPVASWRRRRGLDDEGFPWTRRLWALLPWRPEVVHLHNVHGGWFDLSALPALSAVTPTWWTLHDEWALTGGPTYAALRPSWADPVIAANQRRRSEVFARSRVRVVTPSDWLHDRIAGSVLAPAVIEARRIAYGIDLAAFARACGDDVAKWRAAYGLPGDALVLAFVAGARMDHPLKDFKGACSAARHAARLLKRKVVLLVVGGPARQLRSRGHDGGFDVVMTGRLHDDAALRGAYVAADAVLVSTWADNFPVVTLEALACGVPVVGSAVGGVVEQIEPGVTGWLARAGDVEAMGARAAAVLHDDARRRALGVAARAWAEQHADQRVMAAAYARWFGEVAGG